MHVLDGGGEGAVLGVRVTVLPDGYAPGFGDLGGYLGARQYAAMAWLGSLRQLDFYHFDAVLPRPIGKNLFRKISLFIATAEIDRKSVVQGKSVSVRVDRGGRRIIKKKS